MFWLRNKKINFLILYFFFRSEHILIFGIQKYNLLWHSAVKMSQNGDNLFGFLDSNWGGGDIFLPLGT